MFYNMSENRLSWNECVPPRLDTVCWFTLIRMNDQSAYHQKKISKQKKNTESQSNQISKKQNVLQYVGKPRVLKRVRLDTVCWFTLTRMNNQSAHHFTTPFPTKNKTKQKFNPESHKSNILYTIKCQETRTSLARTTGN